MTFPSRSTIVEGSNPFVAEKPSIKDQALRMRAAEWRNREHLVESLERDNAEMREFIGDLLEATEKWVHPTYGSFYYLWELHFRGDIVEKHPWIVGYLEKNNLPPSE